MISNKFILKKIIVKAMFASFAYFPSSGLWCIIVSSIMVAGGRQAQC